MAEFKELPCTKIILIKSFYRLHATDSLDLPSLKSLDFYNNHPSLQITALTCIASSKGFDLDFDSSD